MYRRFLVLLVVLFPLVAIGATPGKAKGKITFNGKSKDLAYAYAWKDPEKPNLTVVVLSDTKLEDKILADRWAMIDLAKKDKVTAVLVKIAPNGDINSGTFYTAAEDGYFDAVGMHKWAKKTQSPTKIAGKLSTDHEGHFFKTSYSYSAEFEAPIGPAPKKK